MKVSSILTSTFAVLASASPLSGSDKTTKAGKQQLATFDDLPAVPAAPEVNPVGTYKGIKYTAFDVLQQGVAGVITTGIRPHSGLQVAANGVTDDLTRGSPAFVAAGKKTFDLKSLYLACVVNSVESAAGVPTQCTVAFTAYKKGQAAAFQTVNRSFSPTNAVLSDMQMVKFPKGFTGLDRVEVAVVESATTATLTGLLIDDVSYVLKN